MRRILVIALFAFLFSSLANGGQAPVTSAVDRAGSREITPAILASVQQAIEDEIYDYKREGLYFEVDGNPGGGRTPAVIGVYVSKTLTNDTGVAVYKIMSYGEVYRYFAVNESGLVTLRGDAEGPFRNWGGSVLTVYMATADVIDFLTNQSIKSTFVVDPQVTPARIRAAIERQTQRTGYSFRKRHKVRRSK